jgi:tRNA A-37 threonylcarbamoyl transferase component Bud32
MAFGVDLTGSTLDRRYRITGVIGKGGMGHVYEAVHIALDQRVAVKVLHPRYADEERYRERFLQEARAVSRIRHPNVVEIKDFGDTPHGSVYFVMEYLSGKDLGAVLQHQGALPWDRVRPILLQAAGALGAAHAKRIIHRDIKPGNCFLVEDEAEGLVDVVKLLDFGIAKVGGESRADAHGKGLTDTGEVFGTASYMAPEQALSKPLDARSDVYSLGIMAYEMLVGRVPFTGGSSIEVITQHVRDPPVPLRKHDPKIPVAVEALVLAMIAKAQGDRPESMAALERALRGIAEDAGVKRTRLWGSVGPTTVRATAGSIDAGTDTDVDATVVARAGRGKVVVPAGADGRRLADRWRQLRRWRPRRWPRGLRRWRLCRWPRGLRRWRLRRRPRRRRRAGFSRWSPWRSLGRTVVRRRGPRRRARLSLLRRGRLERGPCRPASMRPRGTPAASVTALHGTSTGLRPAGRRAPRARALMERPSISAMRRARSRSSPWERPGARDAW